MAPLHQTASEAIPKPDFATLFILQHLWIANHLVYYMVFTLNAIGCMSYCMWHVCSVYIVRLPTARCVCIPCDKDFIHIQYIRLWQYVHTAQANTRKIIINTS